MKVVEVQSGDSALVLGLPHTGTELPTDIRSQLTPRGQTLSDTDWHVDRLYDGLQAEATTVRATFHRYVIDANRDPSGTSLYPGQNTTSLVPLTDFDGEPLWLTPPTAADIEHRRVTFHAPYHAALAREIERVREQHGIAILLDCHSIRSVIPYLFEGTLPDLNLGTDEGRSCAPVLEQRVSEICRAASAYTSVVNGRFKGGWTTRHHRQPTRGVHALQMELAQSTYLKTETAPFEYDLDKASCLRVTLQALLAELLEQARLLSAP